MTLDAPRVIFIYPYSIINPIVPRLRIRHRPVRISQTHRGRSCCCSHRARNRRAGIIPLIPGPARKGSARNSAVPFAMPGRKKPARMQADLNRLGDAVYLATDRFCCIVSLSGDSFSRSLRAATTRRLSSSPTQVIRSRSWSSSFTSTIPLKSL